jgi:hypothetical protein
MAALPASGVAAITITATNIYCRFSSCRASDIVVSHTQHDRKTAKYQEINVGTQLAVHCTISKRGVR